LALTWSFSGGTHPRSRKSTADSPTVRLDGFRRVLLPLGQHIGAPCKCLVAPGDLVKIGQRIGEPVGFVSVPVHASVSGRVVGIRKLLAFNGTLGEAVEIESDGHGDMFPGIAPPVVTDRASFVAAIAASGLVGLGGASFPTHVKLTPPPDKKPDTLLINAAECEPYITSDYRRILEDPSAVLAGILHVMHYLSIPRAAIGIEDDKPAAIAALHAVIDGKAAADPSGPAAAIEVVPLHARYPQGAEKMLIYAVTGRAVPSGGLPHDVNVMVLNVSTVAFIADYMFTGIPLVRRRLTLAGGAVRAAANFDVPIGVTVTDLVEAAGGFSSTPGKVLMGGPMMGVALDSLETPIIKANNAIIALDEQEARIPDETVCFRCARCVEACPMKLLPTSIDAASRRTDLEELAEFSTNDCIECGTCTFVCPARRHLVQSIRNGKVLLRKAADKKKKEEARA
jgi:electron transport complex protein RnfC